MTFPVSTSASDSCSARTQPLRQTSDSAEHGNGRAEDNPFPCRWGLEHLRYGQRLGDVLFIVDCVDDLLVLRQNNGIVHVAVGVGECNNSEGLFWAALVRQPAR